MGTWLGLWQKRYTLDSYGLADNNLLEVLIVTL